LTAYVFIIKKRDFHPLPDRLRSNQVILFIQFLGVIQYAPNDVAEIAAMIARISMVQDVLGQNGMQHSPTKERCCCAEDYGSHGEVHDGLHQIT